MVAEIVLKGPSNLVILSYSDSLFGVTTFEAYLSQSSSIIKELFWLGPINPMKLRCCSSSEVISVFYLCWSYEKMVLITTTCFLS